MTSTPVAPVLAAPHNGFIKQFVELQKGDIKVESSLSIVLKPPFIFAYRYRLSSLPI